MSEQPASEPLSFSVSVHVAKARNQVFDAVRDPEQLSHYFTTGNAVGVMATGATVSWDFADFPGRFEVPVVSVVEPERIEFRWGAVDASAEDGMNTVVFDFESLDDATRTKVTVTESGWRRTEAGLSAAFDNCEGWSHMLAALKCWLEYGIKLREGYYK